MKPSSVLLEFRPEADKAQSSVYKKLARKVNPKGDYTGHHSVRETPSRYLNNTSMFTARNTPYAVTAESTKSLAQQDIILERPSYHSPNSRASSVQRRTRTTLVHPEILHNKSMISERLNKVQEKYGIEYKQILKAHGINVEKEDPKEVIKKSNDIFQGTYSVKYFGAVDQSQLGVVSQRVPLQHAPKSREQIRLNSPNTSSRPVKFFYNEAPAAKLDAIKKETEFIAPSPFTWTHINHIKSIITEEDSYEEMVSEALEKYKVQPEKVKHIVRQESARKKEIEQLGKSQAEESQFKLVPLKDKSSPRNGIALEDQIAAHLDMNGLSERHKMVKVEQSFGSRKSLLSTERVGNSPVNIFNRNIKSVRRQRPQGKEDSTVMYHSNHSNRKQFTAEEWQKELSQIKESQQRDVQQFRTRKNIIVAEPSRKKEYVDEFSVPEKFRSHEVKVITTSKVTYSYSKLLNNLYSKTKPEDELMENTKKLKEINIKREELRQAHNQSLNEKQKKVNDDRRSLSPKDYSREIEESKLIPTKGPFCIKVSQPGVNPMYTTFTRIKEKTKGGPIQP